jgi:hypothetical protein
MKEVTTTATYGRGAPIELAALRATVTRRKTADVEIIVIMNERMNLDETYDEGYIVSWVSSTQWK